MTRTENRHAKLDSLLSREPAAAAVRFTDPATGYAGILDEFSRDEESDTESWPSWLEAVKESISHADFAEWSYSIAIDAVTTEL